MIGNKDLRFMFTCLNDKFFGNRIPKTYNVSFQNIKEDGVHYPDSQTIYIHSDFRKHSDAAVITLLHEMAHAALPGYIGYASDGHHGMMFQAKLVELFKAGAYDGIL